VAGRRHRHASAAKAQAAAIPTNDYRQGHRQISLEQVGDRRHPAVQNNVAGFCQCFVLKIDDLFQRNRRPDNSLN
jgi:hypothetical protein